MRCLDFCCRHLFVSILWFIHMATVFPFTERERLTLEQCSFLIAVEDAALAAVLDSRVKDLDILAQVMQRSGSLYHDLLSTDTTRTWESLAKKLSNQGMEEVINLPVKATLGRSLVITKIHLWGFLYKIAASKEFFADYKGVIRTYYHTALFSLMAEDLYRSIIATSKGDEPWVMKATKELIHVWEERSEVEMYSFIPLLQHLWRARGTLVPVLGTLMGSVELLQLSLQLPASWHDFLDARGAEEEVVQALDEFLFSISYEQQKTLMKLMQRKGLASISRSEAKDLLQLHPSQFLEGPNEDDLATIKLYRSFVRRNNLARSRRDALRNGPKHTIEQHLLMYLWSLKN